MDVEEKEDICERWNASPLSSCMGRWTKYTPRKASQTRLYPYHLLFSTQELSPLGTNHMQCAGDSEG